MKYILHKCFRFTRHCLKLHYNSIPLSHWYLLCLIQLICALLSKASYCCSVPYWAMPHTVVPYLIEQCLILLFRTLLSNASYSCSVPYWAMPHTVVQCQHSVVCCQPLWHPVVGWVGCSSSRSHHPPPCPWSSSQHTPTSAYCGNSGLSHHILPVNRTSLLTWMNSYSYLFSDTEEQVQEISEIW